MIYHNETKQTVHTLGDHHDEELDLFLISPPGKDVFLWKFTKLKDDSRVKGKSTLSAVRTVNCSYLALRSVPIQFHHKKNDSRVYN